MKTFEPLAPITLWALDPSITFLNNGSFGAPPLEILRKRSQLLEGMEKNPLQSLAADYFKFLPALRSGMAEFVGADKNGFVFVSNATFGANAILNSLSFKRNSEIVLFPHRYPAIGNTAQWIASRAGCKVVFTDAPKRLTAQQLLIDVYEKAITSKTALVIVDHISSLSGIVFPIAEIIEVCRSRNVPVLVDGAHAAGQVEIKIDEWEPDFYTGNFHKWLFVPRTAGFLYVAERWREKIHPPVISNLYGQGFQEEFAWCGTFDPTPLYCVEDGLKFFERFGGDRLSERNHGLAAYGGKLLLDALGADGYYSPDSDLFASMFSCPLPEAPGSDAATLRARFLKESGVEVHFAALGEEMWIRLSAQVFNSGNDMERLAEACRKVFSA